MTIMQKFTIGELFTDLELEKAAELRKKHTRAVAFIDAVVEEVTQPALARINAKTGQMNDARYLAYVLEYGLGVGKGLRRRKPRRPGSRRAASSASSASWRSTRSIRRPQSGSCTARP